MPPRLFSFLRVAGANWGFLWFHTSVGVVCSGAVDYAIGILIGIALTL